PCACTERMQSSIWASSSRHGMTTVTRTGTMAAASASVMGGAEQYRGASPHRPAQNVARCGPSRGERDGDALRESGPASGAAGLATDGFGVVRAELAVAEGALQHLAPLRRLAAALAFALDVGREAAGMCVGRAFGRPHRRLEDPLEGEPELALLDGLVAHAALGPAVRRALRIRKLRAKVRFESGLEGP